ncbi:hypothetical protein FT663_03012 [Candidozyma haemuli var. vulneris]|uniref:Very-long-chain (3R)-3-hydroxyacyl-CoA dehydratase n=1 Tax=Candidozyma haemuli TaxID=45357 RepID=A0A2V1B1D1_9ASCO|nr:hypothetical protein CXQ85_004093 [[Candida] haemuloni]KAF3989078.1 hypothetical protein FT662_03052 [[Candida] haemuloni var. vulneris]KAF3990848.1 hypothetical protein FT663_03012 [[Candida] haemuloni var. vulneris]PVH23799.1 hypothetical protein CXQ85_004093 [[Candida] haemuloni]
MSALDESQFTTEQSKHPKRWLIAYNSISSSLWFLVFFNTLFLYRYMGPILLFEKSRIFLILTQSLAIIEVINSATGVVKSPVFTTASQVASRLLIVLGIFLALPYSPANYHWVYMSLNVSWAITEIVRYSYYASHLKDPENVPYILTWLRYSLFFVLYPTGVASEVSIIYLSLNEAERVVGPWYRYLLTAILFTYPPGLYTLYTYMIKQRKKVLGGQAAQKKAATEKKTE